MSIGTKGERLELIIRYSSQSEGSGNSLRSKLESLLSTESSIRVSNSASESGPPQILLLVMLNATSPSSRILLLNKFIPISLLTTRLSLGPLPDHSLPSNTLARVPSSLIVYTVPEFKPSTEPV